MAAGLELSATVCFIVSACIHVSPALRLEFDRNVNNQVTPLICKISCKKINLLTHSYAMNITFFPQDNLGYGNVGAAGMIRMHKQ